MVKLNKIYTKTGDDGTTGLVRGPRRMKYDLRVDCYGTVDEANSFIGLARLHTGSMPRIDRLLGRVQNDLFDLGSDLATPGRDPEGVTSLRITEAQTEWIEQHIDQYNEALAPLRSFILPGGTPVPGQELNVGNYAFLNTPFTPDPMFLREMSYQERLSLVAWNIGQKTVAVKCDLCYFREEGPACVIACPHKALILVDENTSIPLHLVEGMKDVSEHQEDTVQGEFT